MVSGATGVGVRVGMARGSAAFLGMGVEVDPVVAAGGEEGVGSCPLQAMARAARINRTPKQIRAFFTYFPFGVSRYPRFRDGLLA